MRRFRICVAALAVSLVAPPALGQGAYKNNGESFVEAIRKEDSSTALRLLGENSAVINARDSRGDTALILALRRTDREWVGYLLRQRANVDLAARDGDTPLIAAARVSFADAVGWLLGLKAKVDASNKLGETALIVAVQARDARSVRALLDAGADPDKTDYAGYSARDYAKRDNRSRQMSELIEAKRPKK